MKNKHFFKIIALTTFLTICSCDINRNSSSSSTSESSSIESSSIESSSIESSSIESSSIESSSIESSSIDSSSIESSSSESSSSSSSSSSTQLRGGITPDTNGYLINNQDLSTTQNNIPTGWTYNSIDATSALNTKLRFNDSGDYIITPLLDSYNVLNITLGIVFSGYLTALTPFEFGVQGLTEDNVVVDGETDIMTSKTTTNTPPALTFSLPNYDGEVRKIRIIYITKLSATNVQLSTVTVQQTTESKSNTQYLATVNTYINEITSQISIASTYDYLDTISLPDSSDHIIVKWSFSNDDNITYSDEVVHFTNPNQNTNITITGLFGATGQSVESMATMNITRSYSFTLVRSVTNNVNLSSLSINSREFNETYSDLVDNYTINLNSNIIYLHINADTNDDGALYSYQLNGSGNWSTPIDADTAISASVPTGNSYSITLRIITDSTTRTININVTKTPLVEGVLNVHYINIGQGDCMFIELPDGTTMMNDCGIDYNSHNPQDVSTGISSSIDQTGMSSAFKLVYDYLNNLGYGKDSTINYLVVTHPHSDHYELVPELLANYVVTNIFDSGAINTAAQYTTYLNAVTNELGKAPTYPAIGDYIYGTSESLCNVQAVYKNAGATDDLNQASLCIKLVYNQRSFLFMGDAETPAETLALANAGINFDADVLKVGHHGSADSTSQAFLNAVTPTIAVYSTCAGLSCVDHPVPATVARIDAMASMQKSYYSATNGDIVISSDGTYLKVCSEYGLDCDYTATFN